MTWRHDPSAVWEDDGETIWATHPAVGELLAMTGTGAYIWEHLPDTSLDDLVTQLSEASGESPDKIRRDVVGYLQSLEKVRLVTHD